MDHRCSTWIKKEPQEVKKKRENLNHNDLEWGKDFLNRAEEPGDREGKFINWSSVEFKTHCSNNYVKKLKRHTKKTLFQQRENICKNAEAGLVSWM